MSDRSNEIVFRLPAGVPQPKFGFFQSVQFEADWGEIIGVQYVAPYSAWAEKLGTGWHYVVELAPASPAAQTVSVAVVDELALEAWTG